MNPLGRTPQYRRGLAAAARLAGLTCPAFERDPGKRVAGRGNEGFEINALSLSAMRNCCV